MDDRRQYRRPSTMEAWDQDGLRREPLPPDPGSPWSQRSIGTRMLLGALAALLIVTLVGTTFLVIRAVRNQESPTTSTSTSTQATATVASGTPTPDLRDPTNNGWNQVQTALGQFADVKFAPSSAQRGYRCGADDATSTRSIGVTTDGGQTWKMSTSPAAYVECQVQISATNALDVALMSDSGPGSGPARVDTHYSIDGGQTWKAAPIPQGTVAPAGALWAGSYLYVWSAPNKDTGQHGFLQVSVNGGAFTSIDPSTLLSGAQNPSIEGAVAGSNKAYLNIGYNGCSLQNCMAIVASGDGGKTWAQIPNKSNIWLAGVVGGTLYGTVMNGSTSTPMFSNDTGATWSTQTLPQLPDGQHAGLCVPAADGICYVAFVAFPDSGVAYLHAGAWTVIPFSTDQKVSVGFLAVSLGAGGHAAHVWALGGGKAPGIYWHALP